MKNWVEFSSYRENILIVYRTRVYGMPDGVNPSEDNGKLIHEFEQVIAPGDMESDSMGALIKDILECAYQKADYNARVIHTVISENNKRAKYNIQEVPHGN
jgi:hypothetical protein